MQPDIPPPTSDTSLTPEPQRKGGGCRKVIKWTAIVIGAFFVLGVVLSLVSGDEEPTTLAEVASSGEVTTTQAAATTQAVTTTTEPPAPINYPTTKVSDTGTRVADLEIVGGGLCTMTMILEDNVDSSFGSDLDSNFSVIQVDPPGGFDSLWVNVIAGSGTWEKAVRYEKVDRGTVTVQVEAVGDWVIESDCSIRVATSPKVSGTGKRVVDVEIVGGGLCTMTMILEDNVDSSFGSDLDSNFSVIEVDSPGGFDSLWVNVIAGSGTWEKAVRYEKVDRGTVTLEVEAVGDWVIESDCRG